MTPIQYINACCAVKKVSQAALARGLRQSPQNLNKKFVNGTIRADEMFQIADLLGASVRFIDKETGKAII